MSRIGLLACLLALAGTAASAQGPVPPAPAGSRSVAAGRGSEVGRPFFTCYSPKEYGGSGQSWTFNQDDRGVHLRRQQPGLLEYDGASWRLIETAAKSVARAIAKDDHGRLYVGSTGDLGYLAPDQEGQLQYVSLLEHVKPEDRAFNDVWTAHVDGRGHLLPGPGDSAALHAEGRPDASERVDWFAAGSQKGRFSVAF